MNLLNHTNTLRLFKRIFDSKISTETIIPYYPQKIDFNFENTQGYAYVRNSVVTSKLLLAFMNEVATDSTVNLHSICISIGGKTVFKFSSRSHKTSIPHAVHSASKSITSLACGILISENKLSLEDKLCDIMPEIYNPITKFVQKSITVKDMLIMSTGVGFNEAEVYSDEFYDKAYALSPLSFTPGSEFAYNSLNSYMLGRIVEKISGQKLADFVNERIFEPLGITNYYWETCPKGHTKGGWGLYLSTEDMLKIGNLYLNGGVYNGVRIVSAAWISEAVKKQLETPREIGDFDYGYHIWTARDNSCFLLNGMFGQNVFCFPNSKICIAMNGGIDDFFQMNNIYKIVNKYLANVSPMLTPLISDLKFKSYLKKLYKNYRTVKIKSNTLNFDKQFKKINIAGYEIISPNASSVGVMPIMLQILQNNYTKGISKISFTTEANKHYIRICDSGNEYKIPISDKDVYQTKLYFNGEIYNVASSADFAVNEYGSTVLKIKLDFNETASTRYVDITFEDGIKIKMRETPELEFVFSNMSYFLKDIGMKSIRDAIASGFDSTISKTIYDNTFKPELKGRII